MATPPPIPLDYLVVLDLEAYCDNPADPHGPEIVEFPFLVYDLATHTVLDYKQIYVAPRWSANPNPPPDVGHAFGIDVTFAPSLSDAIAQFDNYVYQSFFAPQKTFYLLTDGHWDITRYLYFEAARKAVMLNAYFRVFFDLRTEFRKCYPTAPVPHDRQAMFDYLRIPPPTRGGSGIDECIGLAALVTRLLRDGHRFTQPEFVADAEWSALNARVPVVATSVAAAQPVGAVIRLRGLPWASSKHDVEKFLSGIPIVPDGIHFVRNVYGKVTGEAFVQLESADGVAAALARHKRSVGRRYIEVFKSSPVDMANHLGRADAKRHLYAGGASVSSQRQRSSGGGRGGNRGGSGNTGNTGGNANRGGVGVSTKDPSNRFVVKVTGLPGDASADDVALLMEGVQITGEGVQLVIRSDGLCIGDAYVEVASEVHVKKALSRAGTSLPITRAGYGDAARYVTVDVRKSSMAQLRAVIYEGQLGNNGGPSNVGIERGRRGTSSGNGNNGAGGKVTNVSEGGQNVGKNGTNTKGEDGNSGEVSNTGKFTVTLQNIPASAGVAHVIELMQGLRVTESDVKMEGEKETSDTRSETWGGKIARVSVRSREERDSALELTGKVLCGQEVSIVADYKGNNGGGMLGNGRGNRVVRMRGLPFSAGDEQIVDFFKGFRIVDGGIVRERDRHGRASGEASVTFASEEEACEAVRKLHKEHMGSRYIELRF